MHLLYSIFFWILFPDILVLLTRTSQSPNYLHKKVWKKWLVKTHPKITKLSDNYTYIILSSYGNFCSDRIIIHEDKGILLLDCYSGVILLIHITTNVMSWTQFDYKPDMASFPVRAVFMVFLHKKNVTESIFEVFTILHWFLLESGRIQSIPGIP